jgi:hypothetical protein
MLRELGLAIKLGRLVVLSGIRGCGKTTMPRRVQVSTEQEKKILVSRALLVEEGQIHLGGLILTLFADLATDKDAKIPTQPNGGNGPSAIWSRNARNPCCAPLPPLSSGGTHSSRHTHGTNNHILHGSYGC